MRRWITALCLAASVLLAGCAPRPNGYADFKADEPYTLASGDRLRVIVFGQDALSNTYAVNSAGNISMPLIGTVRAQGLTTGGLERSVEGRLRDGFFGDLARLGHLDRRAFMKIAGISAGIAAAKGLIVPHGFQLVEMAHAEGVHEGFKFAYISDTHLYTEKVNDRFVRSIIKAVDDVNALDPQPDFVLFGGDLAQLGAKDELDLGAQILKSVKAPVDGRKPLAGSSA